MKNIIFVFILLFCLCSYAQEESALTVETGWITCTEEIVTYYDFDKYAKCSELNLENIKMINVFLSEKSREVVYSFSIVDHNEETILCYEADIQKGRNCAF